MQSSPEKKCDCVLLKNVYYCEMAFQKCMKRDHPFCTHSVAFPHWRMTLRAGYSFVIVVLNRSIAKVYSSTKMTSPA